MFGREIHSVRISLTDRCNLRCQYCMPEGGIPCVERKKILTYEEILRLVKIFRKCGIIKFRLTGGEPTLRHNIVGLVQMLTDEIQDIDLAMTTNGIYLDKLAKPLKKAGMKRLNISLDTLDRDKFRKITRNDDLDKVLRGISVAKDLGFEIKINAVALKEFNTNEEDLGGFINFSEENDLEFRFIELMPFSKIGWNNGSINNGGITEDFISSKEIIKTIRLSENITKLPVINQSQTSRSWSLREGKVKFGFISSVSESFCDSCDRIRITAEGYLRPCLHASKEYPLIDLLRNRASDEEIITRIRMGLNEKWKEHPDFLSLKYVPPLDDFSIMTRIGG